MSIAIDLNMTTDLLSRFHRDVLGDNRHLARPRESTPTELARAREQWSARAGASYATQAQLTTMIQRLMSAGAPIEILSGAIDTLQDLHRHMVWASSIAESVGGLESAGVSPHHFDDPAEGEAPWLAIALDGLNIFGFNLSLSIPFLDAIATISSDEIITDLTELIGDDLTYHGDYGWALMEWLIPRLEGPDRTAFESALIPMLGAYEKLCFGGPQILDDLAGQAITVEPEETNLGTLSSIQHAAIFYHAVTETLFPRLEELGFEPVEAWHRHYRADEARGPRPSCVMAVGCLL